MLIALILPGFFIIKDLYSKLLNENYFSVKSAWAPNIDIDRWHY